MLCPNCKNTTLLMTNRNNVEIDYCPDCRGVWLDRGELDKIIELSIPTNNINNNSQMNNSQNSGTQSVNTHSRSGDYNRIPHTEYKDDHFYNPKHKKKKDNWFEDMFDF
ncbi:MAG: zf-TFIIB domain-containing protein [Patescibacteria group bacterium]